LLNADIVLTAKNKTRNMFNTKIRELHGSTGKLPCVGDKLVCRKNNWNMTLSGIPLVNGIIGKMVNPIRRDECNFAENIYRIDFQPDYINIPWEYYEALPCDYDYLTTPCGKKEINKYNYGAKMEFAEAITVHLSQGSQFGNVVYYDEWIGDRELMNQLRYTAITRATDKVYMFI
jgi:exodeoxyribonuclease-5